ncbi:hypothetical protein Naga_100164g1 [Nannochloropsis gaditana]|uniref:Uncharacterized protein n=1 Tax=Nannochloropsis gaditana TaxID=72520 RepID=W7T191_9STRA|nr:hypothetical protein Naga_100164g1 [Nannochloropsis gaditana]
MAGGYTFVGGGTHICIGSPSVAAQSTAQEAGIGGTFYLAAGYVTAIGSPVVDFVGIALSTLAGEFVAVGAGFLVWIGGPFVEYSAIEVFKGYGGTLFVGTGALVVGYSPLAEAIAIVPPHKDYWVQGTCEPYEAAWAPGPPFFVTGGGKNCDVYEEPPEEKQKNWRQSGRDEARVMLNALFREQEDSQRRRRLNYRQSPLLWNIRSSF